MENYIKLILLFSTLLASVLSAPYPLPQDQPGPFAAIGNFIQRLQTSFNEGSDSIRTSNNIIASPQGATNATTTAATTPTTTTTSSPTPTNQFRPPPNPFDSINAILDNIGRSSSSNNNNVENGNNNIFGSVPGRNLQDTPVTTQRPFLSFTTTRSPFDLEGINQGINAFLQAFIKTNIEKLFKPGQDRDSKVRRSDSPEPPKHLNFGEVFFNGLFKKHH